MRDGAVDFYGEDELRERLATALEEGRPLRVKLGLDPSSPNIHLGHTVVLSKLRRFQELGHMPIFLVGDFTARIGDPSGKKKTRPALSEEQVKENAATYVEQAGLLLDVDRAEIRFNGEWMDALKPSDFVRLCSHYTVARLLERDDFAKRYAAGAPIAVHEFLYPFAQAYDSVALHSDVELGGTDQTFNLLMAREIQRDYGQPPQAVITHPLLVGTDGAEKMSKSLGNAIGISDPPEQVYGQVMSISDALMLDYYDVLSAGEWDDLAAQRAEIGEGGGDPLAFKHTLASRIVERFRGADAAAAAAEHFRSVIQKKEVPDDVPELTLAGDGGMGLLAIIVQAGFAKSNGEARRLVVQGGVALDGERVDDPTLRLGAGGPYLLKVGKRRFDNVTVS
ncbi:MAG: tyrosine--tRNA ligase [Myxococcota bacterium]